MALPTVLPPTWRNAALSCEHLLAAAEDISKLIADEGASTVLITARMPLHLSHEREYAVAPLPLPGAEVT